MNHPARTRCAAALLGLLGLLATACGSESAASSRSAPDTTAGAPEPVTSDQATDASSAPVVPTSVASPASAVSAGGTASQEITEPVTIRFENYNLATAGPNYDATVKMIEAFEAANPLITVETTATGDQEMFPSIQAEVVAGDPPDVAQLLLREWDLNLEHLPVVALDDMVGADAVTAHVEAGHPVHPRALALTVRDGKTYGLPYVFSTPTLFYNADLFRAAGLDPDDPPTTWDQVAEAAQAIADATDAGGLYISCIELDWCTQGLLLSNGGRVMSPDRSQVTWAGPESLAVYSFWQGLAESGAHVDLTGADALDAFSAGNLGLLLQTSAVQGALVAGSEGVWELRTAGMPAFGDRPAVPVNSGSGLAVFATDPDRQAAAWELVKFLTSEEAMQIIATEMGYLPLRPGMIDDPQYLADWEHRELIVPNLEQLDTLEPSLSFPGQNALQIRDLFLTSLELVLFNGADVEDTFAASQADATELMP